MYGNGLHYDTNEVHVSNDLIVKKHPQNTEKVTYYATYDSRTCFRSLFHLQVYDLSSVAMNET